jgi:hypothetical protein
MVMMKPGLGKGLGQLMNGDRVAGAAPAAPPVGRGLNTLISSGDAPPAPQTAPAHKVLLPPWFFFSADLLLLAYAVAICFDAPKPLDLGSILFCAAAIGLGGILAVIGVLRAS